VIKINEKFARLLSIVSLIVGIVLVIKRREFASYSFNETILFVLSVLLPVIGTFAAYITYDANVVKGLEKLAYWPLVALIFFPIVYLLSGGKNIGLFGLGLIGLGFAFGGVSILKGKNSRFDEKK
jgi:hypothetical protein